MDISNSQCRVSFRPLWWSCCFRGFSILPNMEFQGTFFIMNSFTKVTDSFSGDLKSPVNQNTHYNHCCSSQTAKIISTKPQSDQHILLQHEKRKNSSIKTTSNTSHSKCKIKVSLPVCWWTDPLRMWIRSVLYLRGVSSALRTCRASNTFPSSRYSRYFCCSSRNFIRYTGRHGEAKAKNNRGH